MPKGELSDFKLFEFEDWAQNYAEKHISPDGIEAHKSKEDDTAGSSRTNKTKHESGGIGRMGSRGLLRRLVEGHSNSGVWQREVNNAFARNFWAQT